MSWRGARNRALVSVHEGLFRASRGRLGRRIVGMDVIMITTVGARTMQHRRTMLTVPVREDGTLVLVASNGGNAREPDWCANLRVHPEVEVTDRGRTTTMIAMIAGSEEKRRLWPQVVAAYAGYAAYQKRSPRDIPLVILRPT